MNRLLLVPPVRLLTLVVGYLAFSDDIQKGADAFQSLDYATALKEWRPLAEQGDAEAQYNLGIMYANGQDVPRDCKAAVMWYRKAADLVCGTTSQATVAAE